MTLLLLVVASMLAAVVLVGVGDRLRLPWPVLLVTLAAGAAFVPGVEAPSVDPELILPLLLPPLLYATARRASWSMFRARWRAVVLLAVGLVLAVYLAADELGASGVIAVVVAALQMGGSADADDSQLRLTGGAFWDVVEMLVTAAAFALVGLELRTVLADAGDELGGMLLDAGAVAVVVVGVRIAWMLLAAPVVRRRDDPDAAPRTTAEAAVLSWSGMRGLATIALALGLPFELPERAELLVIAAVVLGVTLVLPGFTLPVLLRVLGVPEDDEPGRAAERELAVRARRAALDELQAVDPAALGLPGLPDETAAMIDELRLRLGRLAVELSGDDVGRTDTEIAGDDADGAVEDWAERRARLRRRRGQWTRLRALALGAARREVLAARGEAGIDPQVADRVLHRLDVHTLARPGP